MPELHCEPTGKPLPGSLSGARLAAIVDRVGTPVWIYDARTIRAQVDRLRNFDVIRYAQKAGSNIHILRLMKELGVVVDAVSAGEVERALTAGYTPGTAEEEIVFTADLLDREALKLVAERGIPVNAGSPQMLEQLGQVSPGHRVWLRINPGFGHGHSRKTNTGGSHSKHGIWHEHLAESLKLVDRHGLKLVGFHIHIGSGVDYAHLERVCDAMVEQVKSSGRDLEAISAGGGLSIPYAPDDPAVDTQRYFSVWDTARREISDYLGHRVRLEIEPGRFLVAESGVLAAEVRASKKVADNHFLLVDAGFNDLVRPAMYGSRHQVTILAPDGSARSGPLSDVVLAGPLCEAGDVFTQSDSGDVQAMQLPEAVMGDLAVFHDTGAYGSSMSSNYNSRPLIPEVLVDGVSTTLIRRRQTVQELIALEADPVRLT
ncbi:diaminopimelate decarboxylase [Arthrobacter sp. 4R501]|uniref:diaminopimelate decarboxylase n=1 Tax=Arthrobacter sp. 4R501 TaxID=2058886 RepID=UPI000CE37E7C|nr:diaminopimelate decarboxylase [Arthrobacter sp. 4R501]